MSERMLRLRVRERTRRASRFITESDAMVDYGDGGQEADVPWLEALQKLGTGNFDLCDGEELSDQETRFLEALCDPLWPAKNGHYPKFEEFA